MLIPIPCTYYALSPVWLLAKRLCKLLLFTRFPPLLTFSWQWRQVALVMSTVSITKCFQTLLFLLSAISLYMNMCSQLVIINLWKKVTIPVKINGIGTNTDANISGTLKFMHVRYLYSVPHSFCFCLFFSIFSSLIYFSYHYPFHQHFLLLLVFLLLELFQRLVLHF